MFPLKLAAAAGATLLATTSLASATIYTYSESHSFGPQTTNWGTSTNTTSFNPTKSLGFTGFTTSLGTLLQVKITVTETLSGTIDLTNDGSGASRVAGDVQNTAKAKLPGNTSLTVVDQSNSVIEPSLGAGQSSGTQAVSGSASQSTTISFLTDPTTLDLFNSSWSAVFGDLGQVAVSSDNGNGHASYTDLGKISITAAYTYNGNNPPPAVPEPGTLATLGSALAGLGVVRLRRRR